MIEPGKPVRLMLPMICIALVLAVATPSRTIAQSALDPAYQSKTVMTNLNLPTALSYGPDGALYISELNGGENDGKGRIVRYATFDAAPEVILDNLMKPTGFAFAGGYLYIAARNQLLVSAFKDGRASEPRSVFQGTIPFNGRSIGQVAVGPDGMVYFQSTGTEAAPRESGFIYSLQPGAAELKVYARGFKNAYAFAWAPDRQTMYATEIGDANIAGVGAPPEELNVIKRGGNYGWPQCYANQKEDPAWGGNRNICADTDVPLALFPPSSMPTAVAWFDGRLIVALNYGVPPRLINVDPRTGKWADFSTLTKQPIALLVDKRDGRETLLMLDFADGTVTQISRAG